MREASRRHKSVLLAGLHGDVPQRSQGARVHPEGSSSFGSAPSVGQGSSTRGRAAKRRGESNAKRARDRAAWKLLGIDMAAERSRFVAEIQPGLAALTVKQIERASGLSLRYALLIRDGRYIPHPVHYPALAALIAT